MSDVMKVGKGKAVNVAGKSRNRQRPYAVWTDPRSGWRYSLLKSWQVDNGQEYARWFVHVASDFPEMGDEYVKGLVTGAVRADDLEFDTSVWPTREDFIVWARGSRR